MKLSNKFQEENWIMDKRRKLSNSSIESGEYNTTYTKKYLGHSDLEENRPSNKTMLQAHNQFLKENNEVSQTLTDNVVSSHSFTTVIVIASIFLFLTTSITTALVVFCRKRNSVFAFQKSEQDAEYELDNFNSEEELEFTETEIESEVESIKSHKSLTSHMVTECDFENSPVHTSLMSAQHESEIDDSPVRQPVLKCHGGARPKQQYKHLNAIGHSKFDVGSTTRYFKNKGNKYNMIISHSSDGDPEMQIHITNKMTNEQITVLQNENQHACSSYSHSYGQCKSYLPNQDFTYKRLASTDKTADNHTYLSKV